MTDEYDSWRRYEDAKAFKNKLAEIDRLNDRIEKLEAALREIADDGGKDLFISGRSAQRIARKALEKNHE